MKFSASSVVLAAVFATTVFASPAPASPPKDITYTFDCAKSNGKGAGETCNTMCFGLNCHKIKNLFTYDAPSDDTKKERRGKAGCSSDNRCSKSPFGKGYECDEFPFATTEEADKGGQINRCVPAEPDHRSQGGQILQITNNKKYCNKQKGCTFKISFMNESAFQYCKKSPDCKADGNIYTKDGPVKRDLAASPEEGGHYRLRSGATIYSPSDLEIGTLSVRQEPSNETLHNELVARGDFGNAYDSNMDLVEDEVVEKL